MAGVEDTKNTRQKPHGPFSERNPIPTIQNYKHEKQQRREDALGGENDPDDVEPSRTQQTIDTYKDWREAKHGKQPEDGQGIYQTENHNVGGPLYESDQDHKNNNEKEQPDGSVDDSKTGEEQEDDEDDEDEDEDEEDDNVVADTSQAANGDMSPKARRKAMKKRNGDRAEREVTDPVTHLPVKIHDFTRKDLKAAPINDPTPTSNLRAATGLSSGSKSSAHLEDEVDEEEQAHSAIKKLFPPPEFEEVRRSLVNVYRTALAAGLGVVLVLVLVFLSLNKVLGSTPKSEDSITNGTTFSASLSSAIIFVLGAALSLFVVWVLTGWAEKKMTSAWESHVWEAERQHGKDLSKSQAPESVQWLNLLFGNIWPIVNPDLFTSLADMLEDVMQASLPRLVRMVSVEDIGQGSEAIRILGIKWLPAGAATRSVTEDGKIKSGGNDPKNSDRSVGDQGDMDTSAKDEGTDGKEKKDERKEKEESGQNVAEGMEAEEGDFVNMEIAFAYRARADGKQMKDRVKNAHLYLAFYLPGNVKLRKSEFLINNVD